MITVYTFTTESHRVFLDQFFLPTYPHHHDSKLVVEQFPQDCQSGKFMAIGWLDTMRRKIALIITGIQANWGSVFIHCDSDIQFFGPFIDDALAQLGNLDLVGQVDLRWRGLKKSLCAGFLVIRANSRTLQLFQAVLNGIELFGNDQHALNRLVSKFTRYGYLDRRYMSIHHLNGGKIWCPGDRIPKLPIGVLMHHGNFASGIETKIQLMQQVRQLYWLDKSGG